MVSCGKVGIGTAEGTGSRWEFEGSLKGAGVVRRRTRIGCACNAQLTFKCFSTVEAPLCECCPSHSPRSRTTRPVVPFNSSSSFALCHPHPTSNHVQEVGPHEDRHSGLCHGPEDQTPVQKGQVPGSGKSLTPVMMSCLIITTRNLYCLLLICREALQNASN